MYREHGSKAPRILGLDHRRWWVISYVSKPFRPRGKRSGAHSIERRMGPRMNLDMLAKEKNLETPIKNQTPNILAHHQWSVNTGMISLKGNGTFSSPSLSSYLLWGLCSVVKGAIFCVQLTLYASKSFILISNRAQNEYWNPASHLHMTRNVKYRQGGAR
jgi:hypothetical protein